MCWLFDANAPLKTAIGSDLLGRHRIGQRTTIMSGAVWLAIGKPNSFTVTAGKPTGCGLADLLSDVVAPQSPIGVPP